MLSINIIEILKTLNKKEIKRLGEFIKTPYFNSIEKLEDLYNEIIKAYPDFPEDKLNSERLFKKLYPGKEYTDKTIKNLYSEFGKCLKTFIAYEEIRLDKEMIDLNLIKALSKRGSFEMSDKIINEKKKKLKDGSGNNSFWHSFTLQNEKSKNLYKGKKFDLQEIFSLQYSISEGLIAFFLSTFSHLAYHILISLKTQNVECKDEGLTKFIKSFDFKKIIEYLDSSYLPNSVSIKIYFLFLHYFFSGFTEKEYEALKDTLVKNINSFTKADIRNYWENIINLVAIKLLPLDRKFNKEIFELNSFFYGLHLYPDDSLEEFPASMLRNVFTSALIAEEYEWADKFLHEYVNYIYPNLKENETNYNMGLLSFKLKKYEESLAYLSKVNFTDIYENLNIRFYCIMNHIELKHYSSAASMVSSTRQFYKTCRDIPEFAGILVTDALKYFKEIIKCEESHTKLDYSVYREALEPKRYYHKKYILNKMEQLIQQ